MGTYGGVLGFRQFQDSVHVNMRLDMRGEGVQGRLHGDWGRYALDGTIEYMERQDTQTKIRGVRIELGEIETCIRDFDGVDNVIVKKGKTHSGLECLIAYYTEKPGYNTEGPVIRDFLKGKMPDAIIPEHYVRLSSFPMSENGKMDRKALADTVVDEIHAGRDFSPALGAEEAAVAKLWEQVLGRHCADANVSFFDAGGSSLSLIALRRALEESFGTSLSIASLFQNPTIGSMTRLFRAAEKNSKPNDASITQERMKNQIKSFADIAKRKRGIS